ncbi:monogalactosyldiacylglycerol synthase, partial [Thalassiosira pseudonana CCMP1335]
RALKVLFLSSDTGGGHRASATSLAQQFTLLFPGSVYTLCDIVQLDGPPPYNTLVKMYKHLSAHPQQWKLVYNVSNTRAYEMVADVHMKSAMERAVRKRIQKYNPDVVVSVHPLMTNVPVLACSNLSKETGRHLPIFTVCTDLGSAHSMWFANGVEKLFVASEAIKQLAMQRGKVPEDKIIMSGLPIRNDFSVEATKMGDRHSTEGQVDRKIVLVMGGGEGCGRLSHIVDALYLQFVERSIPAVILVVCGRNDVLKESLAKRDWEELRTRYMLARHKGADFDKYMVAADVLVSKAGPGTIAEAASLSLPVMLTSFLPGQEEGNVDYVIEGGFGAFVSDSDPQGISEEVVSWLVDSQRIEELSRNAKARGAPDAAAEIVDAIGQSALRWKNAAHGKGEETAVVAEEGSGEEVEATA